MAKSQFPETHATAFLNKAQMYRLAADNLFASDATLTHPIYLGGRRPNRQRKGNQG
jgi:hypothetical protein